MESPGEASLLSCLCRATKLRSSSMLLSIVLPEVFSGLICGGISSQVPALELKHSNKYCLVRLYTPLEIILS